MTEKSFVANVPDECCLCGSNQNLTGEHKIKASLLRSEFGKENMAIGGSNDPANPPRFAQGPKSKAMHFASRVCEPCNTSRTQASDKEFDKFHDAARHLLDTEQDPLEVFREPRYAIGSEPYLNVFRYFAKLLCCHIADAGGPRFIALSHFAIGKIDHNIVSLAINKDWTYQEASRWIGQHQYAAHGGLVIYGRKRTGEPTGFHSTLTVGRLQYVFYVRLNWFGRLDLKLRQRKFYDWCVENSRLAEANPFSSSERKRLGLE